MPRIFRSLPSLHLDYRHVTYPDFLAGAGEQNLHPLDFVPSAEPSPEHFVITGLVQDEISFGV